MKRFGIGMALMAVGFGYSVLMDAADGAGGDLPGAATVDETGATAAKPNVKLPGAVDAPPSAAPKDDAAVLGEAGFAPVEGDPGLNYAMKFLAGNGFNAENPAVAAAFEGDFSLLKAELAQKGIAGWEQALGLAEQSFDRHVKANEATQAEVGGIVTALAEQMGVDWEAAVGHVSKAAGAEERSALNTLLSDPKTAHIAANYITNSYINAGDTEIEPASRATGAGAVASNERGGGALSRREYTAEMAKLRQSVGDSYMDTPQAQALYRRLKG
jgi:hypothetical protein